jgi:hypothetical protein
MDDKTRPLHWRLPTALSRDTLDALKRPSHFALLHPYNRVSAVQAWCNRLPDIVAQVGTRMCALSQCQTDTGLSISFLHNRASPPDPLWTFLWTGVAR